MRNHVPALETCQRLKAAGFPQETEHSWRKSHVSDDTYVDDSVEFPDPHQLCAAPLLTEILEQLPQKTDRGSVLTVQYSDLFKKWPVIHGALNGMHESPAEAAALLWLELNHKV